MAKINFINSQAVDIIRTAYYIRGLELMKLSQQTNVRIKIT